MNRRSDILAQLDRNLLVQLVDSLPADALPAKRFDRRSVKSMRVALAQDAREAKSLWGFCGKDLLVDVCTALRIPASGERKLLITRMRVFEASSNLSGLRIYCAGRSVSVGKSRNCSFETAIGIYSDCGIEICESTDHKLTRNAQSAEAVLAAAREAAKRKLSHLTICTDSESICAWAMGIDETNSPTAQKYIPRINASLTALKSGIEWVPERDNPAVIIAERSFASPTESGVERVYYGSSAAESRKLYKALEDKGMLGEIAATLLRIIKSSSRAKKYKGSNRSGRASYSDYAYESKGSHLTALCALLSAKGVQLKWGWREDAKATHAKWVLYVELPTGQASFHSPLRMNGPDFKGAWNNARPSEQVILDLCEKVLQDTDHA